MIRAAVDAVLVLESDVYTNEATTMAVNAGHGGYQCMPHRATLFGT